MSTPKRISNDWTLPDELWEFMEPLLPRRHKASKRGRKPLNLRKVANGIFYVLRTGVQWKAVPREFGSGTSVHRYFQEWVEHGVFWKLWQQSLLEYDELEGIQWEWQSIDGGKTKSPLGGEKNGKQSNRQVQVRHQKKSYNRWLGSASRTGGCWGQRS